MAVCTSQLANLKFSHVAHQTWCEQTEDPHKGRSGLQGDREAKTQKGDQAAGKLHTQLSSASLPTTQTPGNQPAAAQLH